MQYILFLIVYSFIVNINPTICKVHEKSKLWKCDYINKELVLVKGGRISNEISQIIEDLNVDRPEMNLKMISIKRDTVIVEICNPWGITKYQSSAEWEEAYLEIVFNLTEPDSLSVIKFININEYAMSPEPYWSRGSVLTGIDVGIHYCE